MSYRTMRRYANSDLGEFRNKLFSNQALRVSGAAQVFGTLFHGLLLEAKLADDVSPKMTSQLNAMRESALGSKFLANVLQAAQVEQVRTWVEPLTGLPCKAQLDIWAAENELVVDIKTTSARSYGEFLKSCEDYHYDRQAAFYLDGTPEAKRFVILGVQKQAPYEVFYFEATACRGCIEGGRKKYQGLLKGVQRTGFVPSSWGLKTVPQPTPALHAA
ncbi:PD-(D/E)XK nuclease-like domain-containing protein [Spirosoma arcticum]